MGTTKWGKGTKVMAMANRAGLPLAVCAASATPQESRLVTPTLDSRFIADLSRRLIGDLAYDADPLDGELAKVGVEIIALHRRCRWKIERLFAWLGNFRRLVVRYERSALNYLGFVHLGCVPILLRHCS